MKKLIVLLLVATIGCQQTPEDIKQEIRVLEATRNQYSDVVDSLNRELESKRQLHKELSEETRLLTAIKENKPIKYVLTFELSQSHFTLDLGTHLKDSMNTVEFSMAVDKEFYDSVHINQDIVNEFRAGSALFKGSLGSWHIVVKNKNVSY